MRIDQLLSSLLLFYGVHVMRSAEEIRRDGQVENFSIGCIVNAACKSGKHESRLMSQNHQTTLCVPSSVGSIKMRKYTIKCYSCPCPVWYIFVN